MEKRPYYYYRYYLEYLLGGVRVGDAVGRCQAEMHRKRERALPFRRYN
jgi:hypothetical protein